MSLAPMTAPGGIPPWLIPGASSGGILGGIFSAPGMTPPFAPPTGGAPANNTYGTPMAIPSSAWPKPMQVMDKLGGLFGANSQGQGMLAGIDPSEAKRRSLMAAGAAMLEASGPQAQRMNAGQIAARGMLAGQKANDEYVQDQGRQFYLNQLAQQQQMALEQQKRAQQLEQARARTMAGAQFNPEALEAKASELYAAGDVAGAEGLLEQAMKIRNYQVAKQNADTNASIAARGQNQYDFMSGPNGLYRTDPRTGQAERVASWAQFNPNVGGGKASDEMPLREQQILKDQLTGQISSLVNWAENDGGKALGSPKLGAAWDKTVGSFFGTEDSQMRRQMNMVTAKQLLEDAKYLKPLSNSDITFLERSMPVQEDAPELWAKWLREFARRAQIDLGKQGSVYDKYQLERPQGQAGNKSGTGSF